MKQDIEDEDADGKAVSFYNSRHLGLSTLVILRMLYWDKESIDLSLITDMIEDHLI